LERLGMTRARYRELSNNRSSHCTADGDSAADAEMKIVLGRFRTYG